MADYKCECGSEKDATSVRIRIIDGEARHDIKCDECGKYMEFANPKSGVPSFKRDSHGRVY